MALKILLKNCIKRHYLKDMMSRTLLKRPHSLVVQGLERLHTHMPCHFPHIDEWVKLDTSQSRILIGLKCVLYGSALRTDTMVLNDVCSTGVWGTFIMFESTTIGGHVG